ncbi:hypothetical protein [uncultured Treponema sp.]|uniref:hypothetical protein n=1 Tax=uncultured Treponema sp. TaxID=162155 RepID=UPI0025CEF2F4|nr:hypothetical protein [uncultured Treponema sp.]
MKKVLFAFILIFLSLPVFCDNWTLGVMEFSFKQKQKRAESTSKAASVLPQLIIEQFSNENMRTVPQKEQLDRKLKELQTARLSLFLQLSKEYKTRDSLVLTTTNSRKLKKLLEDEMEKIRDIEVKIDENLAEVKKAVDEAAPKIARDEEIAEGKKRDEAKKNAGMFPFQLPFPFFQRDEKDQIVSENVVLYKGDSTALFKPAEKSLEAGFTSWDFEQEVTSAKINGLITGEITTYGDYCSVTTNLRIYPGGQILGTVREVGLLSDLMPLATSIARNLDSKIANALPVVLEFEIEPKEIAANAKIMIDGVVFSLKKSDGTFDNKIIKDAGIHRINISADGYEELSFTYAFSDEQRFLIHANLVPEVHGLARIRLKKYRDGVFHTYGLLQSPVTKEEPWANLEVNSKSVLGVFTVPKESEDDSDSSNIAFFRIPEVSAFDGASLVVNAKTFDREANIDKRRRWMYTAYTALICSLPLTFYTMGEFTSENTAYSQGYGDYDRLRDLQNQSNICVGISTILGAWTAVELVRYLWAADRVLPAKAKIDKKAMKANASVKLPAPEIEVNAESETESEKSATIIENNEINVN